MNSFLCELSGHWKFLSLLIFKSRAILGVCTYIHTYSLNTLFVWRIKEDSGLVLSFGAFFQLILTRISTSSSEISCYSVDISELTKCLSDANFKLEISSIFEDQWLWRIALMESTLVLRKKTCAQPRELKKYINSKKAGSVQIMVIVKLWFKLHYITSITG